MRSRIFLFHDQHRCAAYAAIPQKSKSHIGLLEAERFNLCSDARLGGNLKKFLAIAAAMILSQASAALKDACQDVAELPEKYIPDWTS